MEAYAWSVEYAQGLGEHAYATLSWLNEGHLPDHHRDGPATQMWDTARTDGAASYANDHGGGLIFSGGLTGYTASRCLFHARANRIETHGKIDTTVVLLAAGDQLAAPDRPGPRPHAPAQTGRTTHNEIAFLFGRAILNSLESESSTADEEDEYVSGLVTLTFSYRFDRRWLARLSWNRVVTGYDRDTDVILIGGGHRF